VWEKVSFGVRRLVLDEEGLSDCLEDVEVEDACG
jgi:hypothetical protein